MERDGEIIKKEALKIIRDDLKGVDWFCCSDGTVFVDHLYDMNKWEHDKKIINQYKALHL